MKEQLVQEANNLYQKLNEMLWHWAIMKDKSKWEKLERISGKALNRYERRYAKWEELQLLTQE